MVKTFELMEVYMPAQNGNKVTASDPSSRFSELRIVQSAPPTPLGAYVESSDTGSSLFLSGALLIVNGKLVRIPVSTSTACQLN